MLVLARQDSTIPNNTNMKCVWIQLTEWIIFGYAAKRVGVDTMGITFLYKAYIYPQHNYPTLCNCSCMSTCVYSVPHITLIIEPHLIYRGLYRCNIITTWVWQSMKVPWFHFTDHLFVHHRNRRCIECVLSYTWYIPYSSHSNTPVFSKAMGQCS